MHEPLEPVKRFAAGRILFPASHELLNRRGILGLARELRRTETLPPERLRELQLARLRSQVAYALAEVPFYARRFRDAGIEPGDIAALEDVNLLPVLERDDVIAHHQGLVGSRYRPSIVHAERSSRGPGIPASFARLRRHRLVRNTSSGSTGRPTTFYDDGSIVAVSWAHELRVKRWYGIGPGEREARLARVSADHVATSTVVRWRRSLWRQLVLPGMNLTEENHADSLERILAFRPSVLFGITTALTGLADFVRRARPDGLRYRPELVITWAAPLYEHERSLLASVFACPVTNVYGSREVGHVAALCPHGSLHVNQESYLVESVGGTDGRPGELLVTTLVPSPMPFIRYRIGDVADLDLSRCECGRALHSLRDLAGRTGEVFMTVDGRMLAPNFWCRMFMTDGPSESVERFQVVYEDERSARLRIVRRPSYSPVAEAALRGAIERNLGDSLAIELEYVSEIPPAPSGKVELVVRRQAARVMETA